MLLADALPFADNPPTIYAQRHRDLTVGKP
jgi:hypothetical protein